MSDESREMRLEALDEPLRATATETLDVLDGDGKNALKSRAASKLLEAAAFTRHGDGPIPDAADLTPAQRAVAELLSAYGQLQFYGWAIPGAAWKLRRWLGLDPPGVIERPVSFSWDGEARTEPLWQAMRSMGRKGGEFLRGLGLPLAERLEAYADFNFGLYSVSSFKLSWGDPAEIGTDLGEWGRRVAEQLTVDQRHPTNKDVNWPVFLALVRAGVPIEPRWDVLLPAGDGDLRQPTIECATAIPEARRELALIGAVRRIADGHPTVRAGLELLPTFPSRALTELIEANADSAASAPKFARITKRDLYRRLKEIATDHPIVAEALEGPPQAPVLTVGGRLEPRQASDLTDIQQQQLVMSAGHYDGREMTADELLDPEPEDEEASFYGFVKLLTLVEASGKPVYDAWIYMTDSGSIYRAGTTELVAEIIQLGVECNDPRLRDGLRLVLQGEPS